MTDKDIDETKRVELDLEEEVITDEEELARYIAEQELIRSTVEGLGITDPEEALKKTAELTAEQMLEVDDNKLTPEQRIMRNEWRDSVIVMVIAEGVKKRYGEMLKGQGNGTVKNNKFNEGYIQAHRELYSILMNIVPEGYKQIASNLDVYDDKESDEKENNSDTLDASRGSVETENGGE